MRGVRGDGAKRLVAEAESDRERVKPNDFISQHTSEERERESGDNTERENEGPKSECEMLLQRSASDECRSGRRRG